MFLARVLLQYVPAIIQHGLARTRACFYLRVARDCQNTTARVWHPRYRSARTTSAKLNKRRALCAFSCSGQVEIEDDSDGDFNYSTVAVDTTFVNEGIVFALPAPLSRQQCTDVGQPAA